MALTGRAWLDLLVAAALAFALPGCRGRSTQTVRASSQAAPPPSSGRPGRDAAPPPIACPLAKHGNLPEHGRPFDDVEQYIAFLERPERAAWQRPDAVVAALGLTGNEAVVDVGAGSGYFAFRLARALPRGQVVAVDIEPEMVRHLHHKAMTEGVRNLHAMLGKADDPEVPREAHVVFVCDVLHHVADRPAWLGKLAREMDHGARLVLIEFREGKLPAGPPEAMKIPKAELLRLVTAAGFELEGEQPKLLPYQYFLTFRKP